MLEKIWNSIKQFYINHTQHDWLEDHLFYFFLLGICVTLVLIAIVLIRTGREIRKMDRDKRKRDKEILKFLSKKRNKTY